MKRTAVILVSILILGGLGVGVFYLSQADSGDPQAAADTASAQADAAEQADGKAEDGAAEGEKAEEGPAAIPVSVAAAARGDVSTYLTATANLVPEDEVTVLAEIEGRITELFVEEGDRVEAGQRLATLQRDEAQILFDKAEVKAANARMAYERAQRMSAEKLIAEEEFDRTSLEHQVAQQELAEARWRLERTEIRAPFDGLVTRREITLGQHLRPGDALVRVTSFDPLIARIYLPERDVLALDLGRRVDITLKADESVKFAGRIRMISPVVDTATGTVKVTVEAIAPPREVRPGGFVIVEIVRETRSDTLVLPREAVIRELQEAHVFVAENDVAVRREVRLGLEQSEVLEILSGLEPGELVVVAGQGGLRDGAKIRILEPAGDARIADGTAGAPPQEG
jgi:membrane fusion protein (multidrug efflux system)